MADEKTKPETGNDDAGEREKPEPAIEEGKEPEVPQSLDDAKRQIGELQARIKELNAEAKKHRLHAKELEKINAERQAAEKKKAEAEMSEVERLRTQLAEMEHKHFDMLEQVSAARIRAAIENAARKAGIPEDELDTVYALIDLAEVEMDDEGKVTGAEEAIKALLKCKPRLLGKSSGEDINAMARGKGQFAISDEQEKEIASRYGIKIRR